MSDINIDLDAFERILRDARAAGLPAIAELISRSIPGIARGESPAEIAAGFEDLAKVLRDHVARLECQASFFSRAAEVIRPGLKRPS